jgi:hypothetical protein
MEVSLRNLKAADHVTVRFIDGELTRVNELLVDRRTKYEIQFSPATDQPTDHNPNSNPPRDEKIHVPNPGNVVTLILLSDLLEHPALRGGPLRVLLQRLRWKQ